MLLRVSGVASGMCRSQRATGNHTLEALTAFVQVYLRGLIDAPDGSRHFAAQLCFRRRPHLVEPYDSSRR